MIKAGNPEAVRKALRLRRGARLGNLVKTIAFLLAYDLADTAHPERRKELLAAIVEDGVINPNFRRCAGADRMLRTVISRLEILHVTERISLHRDEWMRAIELALGKRAFRAMRMSILRERISLTADALRRRAAAGNDGTADTIAVAEIPEAERPHLERWLSRRKRRVPPEGKSHVWRREYESWKKDLGRVLRVSDLPIHKRVVFRSTLWGTKRPGVPGDPTAKDGYLRCEYVAWLAAERRKRRRPTKKPEAH
jgi:hypothetical protein